MGTIPEKVTLLLLSFIMELVSSIISSTLTWGSELSFISLVLQFKTIFWWFSSVSGFTSHFIWLMLGPEKDFTTTLFDLSLPVDTWRLLNVVRRHILSNKINLLLKLYKIWSFPLRISSINVTKSAENCGFGHN